jgi:hypothetical protein
MKFLLRRLRSTFISASALNATNHQPFIRLPLTAGFENKGLMIRGFFPAQESSQLFLAL